MSENKRDFVRELGELLRRYSREDIEALIYDRDNDGFEAVTIDFGKGQSRTVNVTGDSCIAIMHDVYRALA